MRDLEKRQKGPSKILQKSLGTLNTGQIIIIKFVFIHSCIERFMLNHLNLIPSPNWFLGYKN